MSLVRDNAGDRLEHRAAKFIDAIEADVRNCFDHGGFRATGGKFCTTCRISLIAEVKDFLLGLRAKETERDEDK